MRPKMYRLIEQCVEDGVHMGWNRAHKHTDEPSEEHATDHIIRQVMFQINEWFDFEEDRE